MEWIISQLIEYNKKVNFFRFAARLSLMKEMKKKNGDNVNCIYLSSILCTSINGNTMHKLHSFRKKILISHKHCNYLILLGMIHR